MQTGGCITSVVEPVVRASVEPTFRAMHGPFDFPRQCFRDGVTVHQGLEFALVQGGDNASLHCEGLNAVMAERLNEVTQVRATARLKGEF
jgi:hypothetical protein